MKKIKKYEKLIIQLLEQYASPFQLNPKSEVQEQVIVDTIHHHYQWLTTGNDVGENFKNYINIHFSIKPNGQVWLMENLTDVRVAEELVKLGVPRADLF